MKLIRKCIQALTVKARISVVPNVYEVSFNDNFFFLIDH